MSKTIQYTESKDSLTIKILPNIKPIIKFGLVFQGIILIAISIFYMFIILPDFFDIPLISLITIAVYIFIIIVGKKYVNRIYYREIIEVTKTNISITDTNITSKSTETFPLSEISVIRFSGSNNFTQHPMDNEVLDITGLGVSEREMQFIIADGTMELVCNKKTRKFGKSIASWDADEIFTKIESFTGITIQKNENNSI